jgi:hypothetical protein
MKYYISLLVALVLLSCNDSKKYNVSEGPETHQVIAKEVFHVKGYSYVRALEDGEEIWIAAPTTTVVIDGMYYFGKTMEINNFESKELNKKFETIYFIEKLSTSIEDITLPIATNPHSANGASDESTKPVIEKMEVNVEASANTISIAELFENKEKYNNTIVRLKAEVTKFNPAIMNTNWLHVQDGTDFNGEFDLTVTTPETVVIGDVITFEGKVTLNKDFGAGYVYAIIIEDAEFIK